MSKRTFTGISLVAGVQAAFFAIMGLLTSGNTAENASSINREAMWSSLTILILAVAVIASAFAGRGK